MNGHGWHIFGRVLRLHLQVLVRPHSLTTVIPTHHCIPEDLPALTQLFTISALRTDSSGKGLLSLGIQRFARPLGATTVALAVVLLALGMLPNIAPRPSFHVKLTGRTFVFSNAGSYRYFLIQSLLTQDRFPPARKTMGFIAIALSILVTVVFGVLLGFEHR